MTVIAQSKECGFTLIELIMVIVVLGILAAFALPKFADFNGDSDLSSIENARGSVRSASAISHAACLAASTCNASAQSSVVIIEGTDVAMVYGYPSKGALDDAANLEDYRVNETPDHITIIALEYEENAACFKFYNATESEGTTTPPNIGPIAKLHAGDDAHFGTGDDDCF